MSELFDEGDDRKKKIATAVSVVLLLVLYVVIFIFSAQDGDQSADVSMSLSLKGIRFWDFLTGRLQDADLFEHWLRKSAHFMEYALTGAPVYVILYCHVRKRGSRFLIAACWVFVSAAFDEVHQYFVPGRWMSIGDALIDTCGGMAGALVCAGVIKWMEKHKKHKKAGD